MIGSTCYSGSSFLYLLVVTRVCGAQLAGFYSLSYATAQLLLQVGVTVSALIRLQIWNTNIYFPSIKYPV